MYSKLNESPLIISSFEITTKMSRKKISFNGCVILIGKENTAAPAFSPRFQYS